MYQCIGTLMHINLQFQNIQREYVSISRGLSRRQKPLIYRKFKAKNRESRETGDSLILFSPRSRYNLDPD